MIETGPDHRPAEPVAIVGIGCRFPGGVHNARDYWQILAGGADCITEVPRDRWDIDAVFDPDPDAPGASCTRWGGFIRQSPLEFDARYFGITPVEAAAMDPQQRLFLEVAVEALEDSGHPSPKLSNSKTGVFVGISATDYEQYQLHAADRRQLDAYSFTGTAFSVAAGRLSHYLGLRGPSLAVDTASSSSLSAAHLAVMSLRSGESDLAVAGGVNLMLSPTLHVYFSKLRTQSRDGHCKPFDAAGDGYVRGEGCGVVILKRLRDAVRDGDQIYALIRGSAMNHDGISSGLVVPQGPAQTELIQNALANAGVQAADIGYVEAHGTGTPVGDPIEYEAIQSALEQRTTPLYIGSVKSNIGHLEAAAGIAGLIKAALVTYHGVVPPTLHFHTLNPNIHPRADIRIATGVEAWPAPGRRFAGVSSFGFSGANAHAVLEEAPERTPSPSETLTHAPHILTLSARSPAALRGLVDRWIDFLSAGDVDLRAACRTLAVRRTHLEHRLAVSGKTSAAIISGLQSYLHGSLASNVTSGTAGAIGSLAPIFLYSGQGGHWSGMSAGLSDEPVFVESLERCRELFRRLGGELLDPHFEGDPNVTAAAGRFIFALQIALTELWRSRGVEPAAVIGHSQGEITAAWAAGALALEDAIELVYHRSRLIEARLGSGATVNVSVSADVAREWIDSLEQPVYLAAVNSPNSCTLTGENTAIEALLTRAEDAGLQYRRLKIDVAGHSPHMQPLGEELAAALNFTPRPAKIPIYSTVTGRHITGEELQPAHWLRNICETVRFYDAVSAAREDGARTFVEVSPRTTLGPAVLESYPAEEPPLVVSSLRKGEHDRRAFDAAWRGLFCGGAGLDFSRLYNPALPPMALPEYPWDRQRYVPDGAPDFGAVRNVPPAQLFFETHWRAAPALQATPPESATVLILADLEVDAHELRAGLDHQAGVQSTVRIVTESAADALQTGDAENFTIVVRMYGAATRDFQPDVAVKNTRDAITLAQMLQTSAAPKLVIVSRCAQVVGRRHPINLEQTTLPGLVRSLRREFGSTLCLIDLGPNALPTACAQDILHPEAPAEVHINAEGQRLRPVLERSCTRFQTPRTPGLRSDATYVISGGLGAFGPNLVRDCMQRGARHFLVLGRREHTASATEFAALREAGAQIHVRTVDITNADALAETCAESLASLSAPAGVFHLAADVRFRSLELLDSEEIEAVLRPKVHGAWNLRQNLASYKLDFFVSYASISAVLGLPGAAAYAAANSFLNGFTALDDSPGTRKLSLNWGYLADSGALDRVRNSEGAAHYTRGMTPLASEQAFECLHAVLQTPRAPAGPIIADLDLGRYAEVNGGEDHLLDSLMERKTNEHEPARQSPETAVRQVVTGILAEFLGLRAEDIAPDRAFARYGIDSLMSVQIRNRIAVALQLKLPAATLFHYPTVRQLLAYLAGELDTQEPAAKVEPQVSEPSQPHIVATAPTPSHQVDHRSKRDDRDTVREDAVAIIGMACRLPGGIVSPATFWEHLESGRDAVGRIRPERWQGYDIPEHAASVVQTGGFLDEIDGFDAGFFGISAAEAESMDPQQRLVLEVAYEALENAGIVREQFSGSSTGVFIGSIHHDYQARNFTTPQHMTPYAAQGVSSAIVSNRVSYLLNLHGPSVTMDTACSSSLTAIHLAARSVRSGESDMALAGGVNLILSPLMSVAMHEFGMLSPDGRCKSFDARANGFVRAEGCGLLVLKRYADARRDGDTVLALLRGTAVNQDGATNGLTAPAGPSQEAVIRRCLHDAGLEAADIQYVETHGTGTALGDPIEVDALKSTYGRSTRPCVLGAVKSSIGHTEAAAGVVGLIKTILCLQHHKIPPNLHFEHLNPNISLDDAGLLIPTTGIDWLPGDTPRRAAVSSFGFGGTNAHAIVEEAPRISQATRLRASRSPQLFLLSARSDAALRELAGTIARDGDLFAFHALSDICATAAKRRTHLEKRAVILANHGDELRGRLAAFARNEAVDGIVTGDRPEAAVPRVAFVYSGQGVHQAGMAEELLREEAIFREAMEAWEDRFQVHKVSVLNSLRSDLSKTEHAQPAIFALQQSLTTLWRSYGIEPGACLGHSLGEISAACAAGLISAETAAMLVAQRADIMARTAGQGSMLAVAAEAESLAAELETFSGRVCIAARNGPESLTLAGTVDGIAEMAVLLEQRDLRVKRLPVAYAFHGPGMDAVADRFLAQIAPMYRGQSGAAEFYSTVRGRSLTTVDARHWADNIRQPVLFAAAVEAAIADGFTNFVEVGPHAAHRGDLHRIRGDRPGMLLPSMLRDEPERAVLLESLAHLHCAGVPWCDDSLFDASYHPVTLPNYAWQRRRYWLNTPTPGQGDTGSIIDSVQEFLRALGPAPISAAERLKGAAAVVLRELVRRHPEFRPLRMQLPAEWDATEILHRAGLQAGDAHCAAGSPPDAGPLHCAVVDGPAALQDRQIIPGGVLLCADGDELRVELSPRSDEPASAETREDAPPSSTDGPVTFEEIVKNQLATLLGIRAADIPADRALNRLGIDSFMSVRLRKAIRERFDVDLSAVFLLREATVAKIIERLPVAAAPAHQTEATPHAPTSPETIPTNIREMLLKEGVPVRGIPRLFFVLDRLAPGNRAFNIACALKLSGSLDRPRLEQALERVAIEQDALRACFVPDGESLRIRFHQAGPGLNFQDLSHEPPPRKDELVSAVQASEAAHQFDLQRGPLIRFVLLRLGPGQHELLITTHHSIMDFAAMIVLFRDIVRCYRGEESGRAPQRFLDYLYRESQSPAAFDARPEDRAYWIERLFAAPPQTKLPLDFPRPERRSFQGDYVCLPVANELMQAVEARCRDAGVTPFALFMTGFHEALARWTGDRDQVIGTVHAGRDRPDTEDLAGCFIQLLPVRLNFPTPAGEDGNIDERLSETATLLLADQTHSVPIDAVVDACRVERSAGRNPLYNVGLLLHNERFERQLQLDETLSGDFRFLDTTVGSAHLDLRLFFFDLEEGRMRLYCEYDTALFREETVRHFGEFYLDVLAKLSRREPVPTLPESLSGQTPGAREIAVAANFSIEPLETPLRFWMHELDGPDTITFGDHDSIIQELLNPVGPLQRGEAAFVFLHTDHAERAFDDLVRAVRSAAATRPLFLLCCPGPDFAPEHPPEIEQELKAALAGAGSVFVISSQEMFARYPEAFREYYDAASERLAAIPYTDEFYAVLATAAARAYEAYRSPPAKVIVVDCDQTLWDGVCGEDEPADLEIGSGRLFFQQRLKEWKDQGFLLALCSKNEAVDVERVFEARPDLPLRREDFAAARINWNAKAANLQELATELDLGLGSFVFIDDNPVECAAVRAALPVVTVLQIPESDAQIPDFVRSIWACDRLRITDADRRRNEQYVSESRRRQWGETLSLAEFLRGLDLVVGVEPLSAQNVERASQLSKRVNQFHCSLLRASVAELQPYIEQADAGGLVFSVRDRFGDYGEVGLVLYRLQQDDESLLVDALLLSCRALNRGVEYQMLSRCAVKAQEHKLTSIVILYREGERNFPARQFLERTTRPDDRTGSRMIPVSRALALNLDAYLQDRRTQAESQPEQAAVPAASVGAAGTAQMRRRITEELRDPGEILKRARRGSSGDNRSKTSTGAVDDLSTSLREIWRELLPANADLTHGNFFAMGGTSVTAVRLAARLERDLGIQLSLTDVLDAPTIPRLRELIQNRQRSDNGRQVAHASPAVPEGAGPFPLTTAQSRLWFLDLFHPGSGAYNVVVAFQIRGPLDVARLNAALRSLTDRHRILRAVFQTGRDGPLQRWDGPAPQECVTIPVTETEDELAQAVATRAWLPFDLARGPVFRAHLFARNPEDHVLLLGLHHTVADARSLDLLMDDLWHAYENPGARVKVRPTYLKRMQAERTPEYREKLDLQLQWWREQLAGHRALELRLDQERPELQSFTGENLTLNISEDLSRELRKLAAAEGVTYYMVLLAAYLMLLFRRTGQADVSTGSPVLGRRTEEEMQTLGLFVNTIVLRCDLGSDPTIAELLGRVRRCVTEAFEHSEAPFEEVVRALNPEREFNRTPLVRTFFQMLEDPQRGRQVDRLRIERYEFEVRTARFDLEFYAWADRDQAETRVDVVWNPDILFAGTIRAVLKEFGSLLAALPGDTRRRISELVPSSVSGGGRS